MQLAFASIARAIGIKGAIAIGMALALGLCWLHGKSLDSKLDSARQQVANEQAAHAVTLASVETLKAAIAKTNAEAQARADALENSRREALRDAERLQRAARVSQGQIDALRALAGRTEASCPVPAELGLLLEGL